MPLPNRHLAAALAAALFVTATPAQVRQQDLDGSLIRAAENGDYRSFSLLLGLGANAKAVDGAGNNAVVASAAANQLGMLRLVLDMGATPDIRGSQGLTPLGHAVLNGSREAFDLLMRHNANPDLPAASGETPLHMAVRFSRDDMFDRLLDRRARHDSVDGAGDTPLMTAIRVDNAHAFERLIRARADVDARDRQGHTVLLVAVLESRADMALKLIKAGARHDGMTGTYSTLRMARAQGMTTVAEALVRVGARE